MSGFSHHRKRLLCFAQSRDREIDFDVETAIRVCRGAGYYKQALHLSETHRLHNWYLRIQLEDIRDYRKALSYMATLEFNEVSFVVVFWFMATS